MAKTRSDTEVTAGWAEQIVWLSAIGLTAVFLTGWHMAMSVPWKLATFEQLVHFNAVEPFQHRILLPASAAALQYFLPLGEKLLFGVFQILGWIALIVLAYRALAIFEIGRSDRLRRVLAFSVVVPMIAHLMVPDLFLTPVFIVDGGTLDLGNWKAEPLYYYVYDLPAAVLTLAMTLVLARHAAAPATRHLYVYFLLFALATINRETSAFMIAFFALLFCRAMPWRRLIVLLALQCALFAAIQLPLSWLFADNINPTDARLAGTQYENHFLLNLRILSEPAFFITFVARFMAGLYLPVFLWWRSIDRRLAIALIGFGLPLCFFALLGGIIREYRIFIELAPLMWLAALQVTVSATPRSSPEPPLAASDKLTYR